MDETERLKKQVTDTLIDLRRAYRERRIDAERDAIVGLLVRKRDGSLVVFSDQEDAWPITDQMQEALQNGYLSGLDADLRSVDDELASMGIDIKD